VDELADGGNWVDSILKLEQRASNKNMDHKHTAMQSSGCTVIIFRDLSDILKVSLCFRSVMQVVGARVLIRLNFVFVLDTAHCVLLPSS
jgi:hypothetical protein